MKHFFGGSREFKSPDIDSISVTNLAIVQSMVMLHLGYKFRRDPAKHIKQTIESFRDALLAYDANKGFLVDPQTAVKIASFGSIRGSLNDPVVTETMLERLHLGGQLKQLSLPYLSALTSFLANARITGRIGDLSNKVAQEVANEVSLLADESCDFYEVRLVLQTWIHLASFGMFDLARVTSLIERINGLPDSHFEVHDASLDEQRTRLGHVVGGACFQALFPISYSKSSSKSQDFEVDLGDGFPVEFRAKESYDFIRLVAQLDGTLSVFKSDFRPKIHSAKLSRLVQLTQSSVPAVVFESTLPAVQTGRRERLLFGVYHGIRNVLGNPNLVDVCHVLPHFSVSTKIAKQYLKF